MRVAMVILRGLSICKGWRITDVVGALPKYLEAKMFKSMLHIPTRRLKKIEQVGYDRKNF